MASRGGGRALQLMVNEAALTNVRRVSARRRLWMAPVIVLTAGVVWAWTLVDARRRVEQVQQHVEAYAREVCAGRAERPDDVRNVMLAKLHDALRGLCGQSGVVHIEVSEGDASGGFATAGGGDATHTAMIRAAAYVDANAAADVGVDGRAGSWQAGGVAVRVRHAGDPAAIVILGYRVLGER